MIKKCGSLLIFLICELLISFCLWFIICMVRFGSRRYYGADLDFYNLFSIMISGTIFLTYLNFFKVNMNHSFIKNINETFKKKLSQMKLINSITSLICGLIIAIVALTTTKSNKYLVIFFSIVAIMANYFLIKILNLWSLYCKSKYGQILAITISIVLNLSLSLIWFTLIIEVWRAVLVTVFVIVGVFGDKRSIDNFSKETEALGNQMAIAIILDAEARHLI